MIALALAAALALQTTPPAMGGDAANAPAAAPAPANAVLSVADLQRWIDDQPEVRAYEQLTAAQGVRPTPSAASRPWPPPSPAAAP